MSAQDCQLSTECAKTGGSNKLFTDGGDMAREDRVQRVLAVLDDSGCAMRSIDIFRNSKLRGADFERRVVNNYLSDLVDRGDVLKVDSDALSKGEIKEIPTSESGHFIAASAAAVYSTKEQAPLPASRQI